MATTKNYSASDLFTLANRIRKQNGVSQKEAFAMAKSQLENPVISESNEDMAAVLRNMMLKQNVKFTFKNAKGKEVTTTGTLRMEKVPTTRKVEGKKDARHDNMVVFYDVRHGVMRQYDVNKVVAIHTKR